MKSLPARPSDRVARGFTLVEILIVVVILGILAAIVVPQFSSATMNSRESALRQDLFRMRNQLELYYNQHNGQYPTLADFTAQMTSYTDQFGNTAAVRSATHPFGPYMPFVPQNPFTDTIPIGDGAVGSSAWYYEETTGHIAPNDSAEHRDW